MTVVESEGIRVLVLNTPSDFVKGKESFPRTDGRFHLQISYTRRAEARSSALKSKKSGKK